MASFLIIVIGIFVICILIYNHREYERRSPECPACDIDDWDNFEILKRDSYIDIDEDIQGSFLLRCKKCNNEFVYLD